MSLFLTQDDIVRLTGIKRGHTKQRSQLDKMHIPYRINARGEPIVSTAYLLGNQEEATTHWQSNLKMA